MSIRTVIVILLAVQDVPAVWGAGLFSELLNPVANVLHTVVPIMGPSNPDVDLDFMQLATKYGHPAEQYVVTTEDGYRLKIFHLPGKRKGIPILLFHGIFDSADTWVIRGNESLAITLANAGYDVWLGNVRGNKYSQMSSVALDLDAKFWNFTFNEIGIYDLRTTIDLVLKKTGASKLDAIVHSQGSTIFFVLLSSIPEYNDKVNLLITLAPVAYLQHSPPPLAVLLRLLPKLYGPLQLAGQYQIFSETSISLKVIRLSCSTKTSAFLICLQIFLYPLSGYDVDQIEPAFSVVVFNHAPTASSVKNTVHFGQVAMRKKFARYDYGAKGNQMEYGSEEPPEYELEKITAKVVLLTARNDFFSTQADVSLLRKQLPNIVRFVINPRVQMNHLDYVWGKDMRRYLYPYIFQSLHTHG